MIPQFPDFDPDLPENVANAKAAQLISSAQARAIAGETLPMPPNNLPALRSIAGTGFDGAAVLGYVVEEQTVRDCIAPDGNRKVPGDEGFCEAQWGRLGVAPMPKGWVFEERTVLKLFAIVDGNPILLEKQARALGYARAFAVGPKTLDLGEVEL
jgi:hypothetical protein